MAPILFFLQQWFKCAWGEKKAASPFFYFRKSGLKKINDLRIWMITVLEFLFSIEFCVCNRFPLAFTSIDRTETINLVFIQTKPNEMENLSRIHPPSRDCDRACCETVLLPQSLSNLITCRLGLGHEQHRYRFGETWAAIYSIPASGWQQ